jgi:hypothetical protein
MHTKKNKKKMQTKKKCLHRGSSPSQPRGSSSSPTDPMLVWKLVGYLLRAKEASQTL